MELSVRIIVINIIALDEYLDLLGDEAKKIISQFSCSRNKDVESFLKNPGSALEMHKQDITKTFLVFAEENNEVHLAGYFSLANKAISFGPASGLTKSQLRRIEKFASNKDADNITISAPLIAQIGKDDNYGNLLLRNDLINCAVEKLKQAMSIIGGKVAYLECEVENTGLIKHYEKNGFIQFDTVEAKSGKKLVRMYRYMSKD